MNSLEAGKGEAETEVGREEGIWSISGKQQKWEQKWEQK